MHACTHAHMHAHTAYAHTACPQWVLVFKRVSISVLECSAAYMQCVSTHADTYGVTPLSAHRIASTHSWRGRPASIDYHPTSANAGSRHSLIKARSVPCATRRTTSACCRRRMTEYCSISGIADGMSIEPNIDVPVPKMTTLARAFQRCVAHA